MRLHRLEVTAFGPFAGIEKVDFDELNDAGLFLLTGPTGAGKSSLLDAVCFALYGTVPGVRGTKALKSQHAELGVAPSVVLDLTVQGRRFVVRRTPQWARPKRRGAGLLHQKASASIMETTDGKERLLTARAAEVGLLVTELMGMSSTQFMQVALLPQGEFQTFLRASSQQRHDVLQQLFRTDRFARIEDFVHDESRRRQEGAAAGRASVQRAVDGVADRAATDPPDAFTGNDLAPAAADGRLLSWAEDLLVTAEVEAATGRAEDDETQAVLTHLRAQHQTALQAAERRARREAAQATLDALEESAAEADQAQEALLAAAGADRAEPLLALRDRAVADHEGATARAQSTLVDLAALDRPAGLPGPSTPSGPSPSGPSPSGPSTLGVGHDGTPASTAEALAAGLESRRDRLRDLRAVLPRESAAAEVRRDQEAATCRLRAAEAEQALTSLRSDQVPAELATRSDRLAGAAARAARHDVLTLALTAAQEQLRAATGLGPVSEELTALEDARRAARDRAQDTRQQAQELMARRLAGMAAELAGALAEGAECQVCGSLEHPRPATAAPDAVTVHDQERAEELLRAREAELDAAEESCRRLVRRRDALKAAAGGLSAPEAESAVAGLVTELREADDADREKARLAEEVAALRAEQETLAQRHLEAASTAAALREVIAAHERTVTGVRAEVDAALGDLSRHGSVGDALTVLTDDVERLARALAAVRAVEETATRLATRTEEADRLARELGFAGWQDVGAAVLGGRARDRLEALLQERAGTRAHALAVLAETEEATGDDLREDTPARDPDLLGGGLQALRSSVDLAEDRARTTASRRTLLEDRVTALAEHLSRLRAAIEAWAPARDKALDAESLSRLVRGMGHDNQLQMRLSAYVLATRLDQVVEAANERLAHMRDHRYLLQRAGTPERRSGQAGLGLEIVDQWTGDVRAPTTLSGGETFVVSLSLALGLADVVTAESGGTEVETLFVDEGFGTLDSDTLDDVMDRLDALRAGGRTVGVVSHVSELRTRIPTQVQVEKGRSGSVVRVRTLTG